MRIRIAAGLPWCWLGTYDCVCNTDSVDANLVDGGVEAEKIDKVGSERVFGRESDLETLGLDELNDFNGGVLGP